MNLAEHRHTESDKGKAMVRLTTTILKFFFLILFISSFHAEAQELRKVRLAPHWIPQSQFAGFYVALEKGIYRKYSLDVEIIQGGPRQSSAEMLQKGQTDFALLWLSNAMQLRHQGVRIVNIAQLVNRSSLMLVARKSSGIKTPRDMNGKKVGIWGGDFEIQPNAFFKKYNIKVKTIQQGNSINLFFFGGIDVTSAMWYNEYHTILNSGIEPEQLQTFFFADHGLNFPEEGIYCSDSLLQANPKLCRDFLQATFEGWKYADQNREEAIRIVMQYMKNAKYSTNKAHQRWMLEKMIELYFPDSSSTWFHRLTKEGYQLVGDTMKSNGLIRSIPPFEELYRPVTSGRKP